MADRAVTQSRKSPDGRAIGLCNPAEAWSPRRASDVIADIESKTHRYYVDVNGSHTPIRVVNGRYGKYLRSDPDATPGNNLGQLPYCSGGVGAPSPDVAVRVR